MEMFQARELHGTWNLFMSLWPALTFWNNYSWKNRLMFLILGIKKDLYPFLPQGKHPSCLSSPTKLTSQLARPPFPHLCSLRVCKKRKSQVSCEALPSPLPQPEALCEGELLPHTKCLNSAERLPLLDSSMFITFVFVPRMLNFRDPLRAATSPESLSMHTLILSW